jgi:hypothetical protein
MCAVSLRMTRLLVSVVALLIASAAVAQPAGFEKVLFPIVVPIAAPQPGALGSQWVTDVAVLNRSDVEVPLAGSFSCFLCRTAHGLRPGVTYDLVPIPPPNYLGGKFLLVDTRYVDQVHFGLRVRDISREAQGFGSEVPVVREREFSADGVSLLSVPNQPNARVTLRVYGFDPAIAGNVLVRVYQQRLALDVNLIPNTPPDSLTAERTYPVAYFPAAEAIGNGIYPDYPRYAQISDLPLPTTGFARIDVIPVTPGLRIWAFVTVTNNDTQQVTVISPR